MFYVTWYNEIFIESTCLLFYFDGWALTLFVLTPCRFLLFVLFDCCFSAIFRTRTFKKKFKRHGTRNKERWVGTDNFASATGLLWTTHHEHIAHNELLHWVLYRAERVAISQHGTSVLFTSHI